jgi:hypothetical protein
MDDKNFNFPVPKEILEPFIKDAVSASIIKHLGDPSIIIGNMVERAMSLKVSENGRVENYSPDNKYTYLEYIAMKNIRGHAECALKKFLAEMQPQIEEAVKKCLAKNQTAIAKMLVDSLKENIGNNWCTTLTMEVKK